MHCGQLDVHGNRFMRDANNIAGDWMQKNWVTCVYTRVKIIVIFRRGGKTEGRFVRDILVARGWYFE